MGYGVTKPPRRAGRVKISLIDALGGGFPVNVGMKQLSQNSFFYAVQMMLNIGDTNNHLLINLCVNAALAT